MENGLDNRQPPLYTTPMCNTTPHIVTIDLTRNHSVSTNHIHACSDCGRTRDELGLTHEHSLGWLVSYAPHSLTEGYDALFLCEDCYSDWLENQQPD